MRSFNYSKYQARRTWYNGRWYHSKREADRACELQLLEKAGKIEDLEYQPKFTLQPAFIWKGKKVRAISYTADFQYLDVDRQKIIVEDCKGYRTKVYQVKKKLFLAQYVVNQPSLEFIET